MARRYFTLFLLLASIIGVGACRNVEDGASSLALSPSRTPPTIAPVTGTAEAGKTPILEIPTASPTGIVFAPTPEVVLRGTLPLCGQVLPILAQNNTVLVENLEPDPQALAELLERVPQEALPALEHLLENPQTVGLAAYRLGEEDQGAFLNDDVPMPLASVVKVLHLVAYAEAVSDGTLDPTSTVWLDDLNAFYLPNTDLGAHERALTALQENGRVFGQPQAMLLDGVPGMMISQSSNAATDYLHLLLGQREIEETAVDLGLQNQTAPCPFLGQFLIMSNHISAYDNSYQAWESYMANPEQYGRDVMLLTEMFNNDEQFRQAAVDWRQRTREPNGQAQRMFSHAFNAHGSARDYAGLMARIAQNGLSSPESSFTARRILEWPMQFDANQALFSNLGYKNGSLPGILTTVYYAYPLSGGNPLVVALFYRDLERSTYRQWRDNLEHDEFARWLLSDPQAIPALAAVLQTE